MEVNQLEPIPMECLCNILVYCAYAIKYLRQEPLLKDTSNVLYFRPLFSGTSS